MTTTTPRQLPLSLFAAALLYGGLVVLAGVLGTKVASLGVWPGVGGLAVESGIFAFLLLVVLASATAELYGQKIATRLVRLGFVPLIIAMLLEMLVIHAVPPAPFWHDQDVFARLLGQGARMQLAGLVSYGTSQTLNVAVFSRMSAGGGKRLLWLRAWIASLLSQTVDTALFISISFLGIKDTATGQPIPVLGLMEGQLMSKLLLSTVLVPPLIYVFVALGRRLDGTTQQAA